MLLSMLARRHRCGVRLKFNQKEHEMAELTALLFLL